MATTRRSQAGMTLVEVMVGFVLAGLLLVGMNALWVHVNRHLDDVSLRQKAIFRLNGEMERLSKLHNDGTISTLLGNPALVEISKADYAAILPIEEGSYISNTITGSRYIYNTGNTYVRTTNRADYFARGVFSDTEANDIAACADAPGINDDTLCPGGENAAKLNGVILYFDRGGAPTSDDRNLVWIDRERNVVGQLSWEAMELTTNGTSDTIPCGNGGTGRCRLLTLYLDFPFRFSPAAPLGDMGPVDTITLQTIVGPRS